MRSRVLGLVAVLLVGLGVGVACAETVYEALADLAGPPVAVPVSPVTVAESTTFTTAIRPRKTYGNPKVVVVPTFSVAGATATLEVGLYQRSAGVTTFATLGVTQLMTADATNSDGSRYLATDGWLVSPTLGCQVYDVRVRTISSGSVTWTSWVLGPTTVVAGRLPE